MPVMYRPAATAILMLISSAPLAASDWNPGKAFAYLEGRQQQWAEWKHARKPGGPCFSCHTGMSYLFARRAAGETQPRPLERDLIKAVQFRLLADPPQKAYALEGAEAVLNLLTLSLRRAGPDDPLDASDRVAIDRLWQRQIQEGVARGSWEWFNYNLDPVDSDHSGYFGAALAELALSLYPIEQSANRANLRTYLQRESSTQPLHNRLAWIAFSPGADKEARSAILRQLWTAQSADGGWTTAALGPWAAHPEAPPDRGSNAYATAWAAFTAQRAGVACTDARLAKALSWIVRRQDRATGAWKAPSMNQVYPAGSIQEGFMTDAATGFAVAALAACQVR